MGVFEKTLGVPHPPILGCGPLGGVVVLKHFPKISQGFASKPTPKPLRPRGGASKSKSRLQCRDQYVCSSQISTTKLTAAALHFLWGRAMSSLLFFNPCRHQKKRFQTTDYVSPSPLSHEVTLRRSKLPMENMTE